MSIKKSYYGTTSISLACLFAIIGAIFISGNSFADDSSVSTATISVPIACSMIGITNSAHTAEIPNGVDSRSSGYYPNGIGQTTIKAYCNDSEGFAIYAIGYTDDIEGNTYLRDSALGQTSDIQTNTTFSGANSAWAMKMGVTSGTYPSIVAGSSADSEKQAGDPDFSTWQTIPDDYTKVAYRNSATDVNNGSIASAEGSSITTTYAAYISTTQKAGTYVGKVKYTLVHPSDASAPEKPFACPANYICYHPNANDTVGTMNAINTYSGDTSSTIGYQTASSNASVGLNSTNYSRSGYGFASWNTQPDGSGTNYGPNQTITTGDLSSRGLNLYANWVQAETNVTMQTFSSAAQLYSSAAIGTVIGLTDTRDNNVYAVAKLADGKWWMIENLRLDLGTANITASNTNNPSSTFLQQIQNASSTSTWCSGLNSPCTDQVLYNTSNINRALTPTPYEKYDENYEEIIDASWYSYGVYYNWYTATAGYGTLAFSSNSAYEVEINGEIYVYSPSTAGDVCPSGWRMPVAFSETGYIFTEGEAIPDTGSGQNLMLVLGGRNSFYASSLTYPNNFAKSGKYSPRMPTAGAINDINGLWTSSAGAVGEDPNIILYSNDSGVNGINVGYNDEGYPVRCIAQ